MTSVRAIAFGSFVVDVEAELLLRDGMPVALRPKTWAVLRYLVERPGKLVTKEELLDGVWPDVTVSDALPGVSVAELRSALGDDPREPRFIATVHRRGYRFIGTPAPVGAIEAPVAAQRPALVVGRDRELDRLRTGLGRAVAGERQVILVSGEAGIGKTTLVETFLAGAPLSSGTRVGRGQCVEHFGPGEPFLPVTEAFARLCGDPDGALVGILRRYAPLWLPWVGRALEPAEREAIQREARAATPERMIGTFAEALEAATADVPLVLVLEDLHWSDPSTVDLLGRLALRTERARLLVIGTYRPVELVVRCHPLGALRQHLRQRQRVQELALDFLDPASSEAFLAARFPGAALPDGLAAWLLRRSEGNPLFMTHVADALEAQQVAQRADDGWTIAPAFEHVGVPESLSELLDQQMQALSEPQRQALEAASLVGASFSAAVVAAALATEVAAAEQTCEGLVRETSLVRRDGDAGWPDGTLAARYAFVHSLYREVLERALPPARRAQLHLRLAQRLEAAWGAHGAADIAGDLALHYERGGDVERAARRHEQAAEQALTRQAPREALMHLDATLALRERLAASPERTQEMIRTLVARGAALIVAEGHTAAAVGETYERARTLCAAGEETPQVLSVLGGLSTWYRLRGDMPRAIACGEETLAVAQRLGGFPLLLGSAHVPLASALLFGGDLRTAHSLGETALELFGAIELLPFNALVWLDPRVAAVAHLAMTLMLLGRADEAGRRCDEALAHARRTGHLATLLATLAYTAIVGELRRDWTQVRSLTDEAIALARDPGLRVFGATARACRGHALAAEGDADAIPELEGALAQLGEAGVLAGRPQHLAMFGVAHAARGDVETAVRLVDEGIAAAVATGERFGDAELYRLRAACLLAGDARARRGRGAARTDRTQAAEAALRQALEVARAQEARWFELRASTDLARLCSQDGRKAGARTLLATALERCPGGSDLPDGAAARQLQSALQGRGT